MPHTVPPTDVHLVLHAGTGAIREARHAVVRWGRALGLGPQHEQVLALLTTEAVSNAVRHGPPDGDIELVACYVDTSVTVEVHDRSTRAPVLRRPGPTALGGRGIGIIDRMAQEWGVRPRRDGKTVWFTVDITPVGCRTA